ncbi:MAG: hypothetical protein LCH96_16860 [Actinobacteria bacterium]|nr:hypothetical protein [Actinomycetota bacterium]
MGFLDWIGNYATQADSTFKTVLVIFAGIMAFVFSAQAKFAMSRVIISIIVMAVLIGGILTMPLWAKRAEADFKSSPAIVVTIDPHTASAKAAAAA